MGQEDGNLLMTTEVSVYQKMHDPIIAMEKLGRAIALSGMFGCENEQQGQVIALSCMTEGVDPLSLARKFHLINKKLSMRVDWMLGDFRSRGGDHRVLERTDQRASIKLTSKDGEELIESLTWEEASKEKWPWTINKAGEKVLKDNWATPRARRQMLWARVVSEGIRTLAPEIVAGVYSPEESSDFSESTITDVDYEVAPEQEPESKLIASENGFCDESQRGAIEELFGLLGMSPDQRDAVLAKRGASVVRNLTREQAGELILKLEALVAKKAGDEQSKFPAEGQHETVISTDSPVLQETIHEIKSMLTGYPDITHQVVEHLKKHGKAKLADLTIREANILKGCLVIKNMEEFFATSLIGYQSGNE